MSHEHDERLGYMTTKCICILRHSQVLLNFPNMRFISTKKTNLLSPVHQSEQLLFAKDKRRCSLTLSSKGFSDPIEEVNC